VAPRSVDEGLARRLYREAKADRWGLPDTAWHAALEASAARAFESAETPSPRSVERYLRSLHLEDLALAAACRHGIDIAWEHFVREQRPVLYRAADAIAPGGDARELADSLYADLYGVGDRSAAGGSLLRYFHGRSTLGTWLRAVLSQRYVDRVRSQRRTEPLEEPDLVAAPDPRERSLQATPDRPRFVRLVHAALRAAISRLDPKDRLRLGCYYAQGLTLAQIGKLLGEHEATASRQLARSRRDLRTHMEAHLRAEGLGDAEMAECLESVMSDAGPVNLDTLLSTSTVRKESVADRSKS
jgi:RNA polymerase sigma factor (sigma-70 family)